MTNLTLTKHHGLGNDFLVVFHPPSSDDHDLAELARRLCDRRRGIGADGLLIGETDADHSARMTHLQRRRQPGGDVRQRHPLLRPGAGDAPR